jgi:hypothetical protein
MVIPKNQQNSVGPQQPIDIELPTIGRNSEAPSTPKKTNESAQQTFSILREQCKMKISTLLKTMGFKKQAKNDKTVTAIFDFSVSYFSSMKKSASDYLQPVKDTIKHIHRAIISEEKRTKLEKKDHVKEVLKSFKSSIASFCESFGVQKKESATVKEIVKSAIASGLDAILDSEKLDKQFSKDCGREGENFTFNGVKNEQQEKAFNDFIDGSAEITSKQKEITDKASPAIKELALSLDKTGIKHSVYDITNLFPEATDKLKEELSKINTPEAKEATTKLNELEPLISEYYQLKADIKLLTKDNKNAALNTIEQQIDSTKDTNKDKWKFIIQSLTTQNLTGPVMGAITNTKIFSQDKFGNNVSYQISANNRSGNVDFTIEENEDGSIAGVRVNLNVRAPFVEKSMEEQDLEFSLGKDFVYESSFLVKLKPTILRLDESGVAHEQLAEMDISKFEMSTTYEKPLSAEGEEIEDNSSSIGSSDQSYSDYLDQIVEQARMGITPQETDTPVSPSELLQMKDELKQAKQDLSAFKASKTGKTRKKGGGNRRERTRRKIETLEAKIQKQELKIQQKKSSTS